MALALLVEFIFPFFLRWGPFLLVPCSLKTPPPFRPKGFIPLWMISSLPLLHIYYLGFCPRSRSALFLFYTPPPPVNARRVAAPLLDFHLEVRNRPPFSYSMNLFFCLVLFSLPLSLLPLFRVFRIHDLTSLPW